jgi:hypothetical protein
MQRCKEIVDKYSKMFIDLGSDNPHYENEDGTNKEKVYKNLISNRKVFDNLNSNFFKNIVGNISNFEQLGQSDNRLKRFETYMLSKLDNISKMIKTDIPESYIVDDITVKVDMTRI